MELQATINELIFQVQRQDTQIREMARVVADLGRETLETPFRKITLNRYCFNFRIKILMDAKNLVGTDRQEEQRRATAVYSG